MTGLEGVEWALTLWRPWPALMLAGPKSIENRNWCPPKYVIGKRIALHAGERFDEDGWLAAQTILSGYADAAKYQAAVMASMQAKGIVGTAVVAGFMDRTRETATVKGAPFDSPWFFGPIGWILEDRTPLAVPVPCKGKQGLWRIPAELKKSGMNEPSTAKRGG